MGLGIETETLSFTKLNMFKRERERVYIILVLKGTSPSLEKEENRGRSLQ